MPDPGASPGPGEGPYAPGPSESRSSGDAGRKHFAGKAMFHLLDFLPCMTYTILLTLS